MRKGEAEISRFSFSGFKDRKTAGKSSGESNKKCRHFSSSHFLHFFSLLAFPLSLLPLSLC